MLIKAEEARKRSKSHFVSTVSDKEIEKKVDEILEKVNEIIYSDTGDGEYKAYFGVEFKADDWKQHRSILPVQMRVLRPSEYKHREVCLKYNSSLANDFAGLQLMSPETQKELLDLEIRLFGASKEEIMTDFQTMTKKITLALENAGYQVDTNEYFCGCLFTVSWKDRQPTEG